MTCSCPRGRTTDQLAAYTRSRQLSHFAAPRKPARVHARPLQPSTASNHSRVQRLSTRSTTSPSASAARADAPADAPATPEPSALSTGEAEVLISQSSRSWQSMAEFLTAHSCHIPANVVPQLCAALLRLCSHPAVADPTARRAPSATPFQRYPEPLKELLQAAGACSITDGTFTARTRGQSNARSTEASALMQKAQNGDMSDNEEPTSVEQGVSEWAPVERSLRDALHWEHDSQTWGASPHSHSEQGTRSRPAPHTHQDSSQLQADAQGGSAVSDARPASGAGSTPDTARRRRVWHADSAALQPHGEAARRVLLLLVSAVSTPTTHLHPSRIADPLQTALLAAVLCEVSACVGAGRAGSSTQHWGRYTPPHRQPSFALFASVRSAVLALVQSAVQGFDSPLAQITDTWEPQNSLAPLAARASMALAVVSLSLGPSQARDGDQCVTYAEWDSLVEPCAALMDTQRMQQQRQVAAACCAALLWCEAVLAHASSNGSEGPTSHMDRHWAPLLARLTPQYLRSPTQTLDCVWAVTTRLPNTAAHTTDTTEDTEGTGVTAQPSGAKTSVKANAWAHAPMQAMMAYTVLHPSRPAPLVLEQLLRSLITCQVATTATGKPKKEPGVWRCRLSAAETVVLLCCLAQAGLRLHGRPMQAVQSSLCACDMTQLSVTQLTHTVWALAKMRAALQAKCLRPLLSAYQSHLHTQPHHVSVGSMATLVWALPHVSRPYTQYVVIEQRGLLKAVAERTLPSVFAVTGDEAQQPATTDTHTGRVPPATARELVQLAVGFTQLAYYPGAAWMRAHREACLTLQDQFSVADRQRLRTAYQTLLQL